MTTITLQIDSATARRAEIAAKQQQTTLDALVQKFLDQLARTTDEARATQSQELLQTLRELSRPMGGKPWHNRDELHER